MRRKRAGEEVVENHGRNRGEQAERGREQRLGDSGSDDREIGRMLLGNADEAVHDAPDSAEQPDERPRRADGGQHARRARHSAAGASLEAVKPRRDAVLKAVSVQARRNAQFFLRLVHRPLKPALPRERRDGLGEASRSPKSGELEAQLAGADREFDSLDQRDRPGGEGRKREARHDRFDEDVR
jgi:hypothetical protein